MKLPAELRVRVWYYAVAPKEKTGRVIELHSHNETTGVLSIAISKRYPTLFHVNREARCEAAKELGGEFVTIEAIPQAPQEDVSEVSKNAQNATFEVFVNFEMDTFFLSERFCTAHDDAALLHQVKNRLEVLAATLPEQVLLKIRNIRLTCAGFAKRSDLDEWGNLLLEVLPNDILGCFCKGALSKVEMIADDTSMHTDDLVSHLTVDLSTYPIGSDAPQLDWIEVTEFMGLVTLRHIEPGYLGVEKTFDLYGLLTAERIERNNTFLERGGATVPRTHIADSRAALPTARNC